MLVTGHCQNGRLDLNWPALVQPRQTLVFYMGLGALAALRQGLTDHGLAPETPAALIEKGTCADQRVWRTSIAELPAMAQQHGVRSPALVIVGEVVAAVAAMPAATAPDPWPWRDSA